MPQDLRSQGQVLISRCLVARSFLARFLGLMGRRSVGPDEGVLFPRCNSVHTFFMRIPIDVIFLAADGVVLSVATAVRPWRLLLPRRGAKHVLELAANRGAELGIRPGVRLETQGVFG